MLEISNDFSYSIRPLLCAQLRSQYYRNVHQFTHAVWLSNGRHKQLAGCTRERLYEEE